MTTTAHEIRAILDRALAGRELDAAEGEILCAAHGRDLHALIGAADELRHEQAGDVVTYVVNRNINFTNVCIKHCTFCAFSRDHREEEGYLLPLGEVVRRARAKLGSWGPPKSAFRPGSPPSSTAGIMSSSSAR